MAKKTSKKKKTTGNFKNLSSFMRTPSKEKSAIPKQTKTKILSQKSIASLTKRLKKENFPRFFLLPLCYTGRKKIFNKLCKKRVEFFINNANLSI